MMLFGVLDQAAASGLGVLIGAPIGLLAAYLLFGPLR